MYMYECIQTVKTRCADVVGNIANIYLVLEVTADVGMPLCTEPRGKSDSTRSQPEGEGDKGEDMGMEERNSLVRPRGRERKRKGERREIGGMRRGERD